MRRKTGERAGRLAQLSAVQVSMMVQVEKMMSSSRLSRTTVMRFVPDALDEAHHCGGQGEGSQEIDSHKSDYD